jgi:hypothetical protein
MKSSEVLKLARKEISESREDRFLCNCINRIAKVWITPIEELPEVVRNFKNVFATDTKEAEVEGKPFILPDFFYSVGRDDLANLYYKDKEFQRTYRIAWIDWLIPQYEAKGD